MEVSTSRWETIDILICGPWLPWQTVSHNQRVAQITGPLISVVATGNLKGAKVLKIAINDAAKRGCVVSTPRWFSYQDNAGKFGHVYQFTLKKHVIHRY